MWRFLLRLLGFDHSGHVSTPTYIIRDGSAVEADEAFFASQSGDLERMLKALEQPTNRVDRHFLLMAIVDVTYRKREWPGQAELCARIANLHLSEFPRFVRALKKLCDGRLPRVSTFQQFATLLMEKGEFDQAINVCEQALSFRLKDGTKAGFRGRIERIKKARAKAQG